MRPFLLLFLTPFFFLCTPWIILDLCSASCFLSVFLLLNTAPPDSAQLPEASLPKSIGTYRCFLVSKRPSASQSSLSFSHLGSWHAYVQKGVAGVCIPLFEFPFGSASYLSTLVVVGVQQNYTPNGCLISCSEAPVAASDSRPVALSWSCLPHRGHSFLKKSPYVSSKCIKEGTQLPLLSLLKFQ